jgi:hypothetical protein
VKNYGSNKNGVRRIKQLEYEWWKTRVIQFDQTTNFKGYDQEGEENIVKRAQHETRLKP